MSAVIQAEVSILRDSGPPRARRPSRTDLDLIERVQQTLEVLQGKWKVHLVFCMARGIHRHGKLLDCLPGGSKKILTETLRALERDGLVVRQIYAEVPVRVEYSLTTLGWTVTEPLVALSEWSEAHAAEVSIARRHYRTSSGPDGAGEQPSAA